MRLRARSILKSATPPTVIHLPDRSCEAVENAPGKSERKTIFRRRLAVLLAAIAVPAMAAPGDFGAMPGNAAAPLALTGESSAATTLQPFETPGQSFPGSAFYFLADPPSTAMIALPSSDPQSTKPGAAQYGELIDVGEAATPFLGSMSGTNLSRAMHCLTQAVYYEAASESAAGQRAVAQVVLNRMAHTSWPNSVCGVVFEGSQRSTGCQFTFTCDGSLSRKPSQSGWKRARQIASDALSGEVYEPIGLATHYHTHWVNPYWASSLDHIGTIGAHRFYKNRGRGGAKAAFSMQHTGLEPSVTGRTTARASAPAQAPISNAAQSSPATNYAGHAALGPSGSDTSPEISTPIDPAMEVIGQVKPDYSQAGQWKVDASPILSAQEAAQVDGSGIER